MLLRSVLENPACDTARLVFADWLEENGEPERAAFIRAEVGAWASGGQGTLSVGSASPARRHYRPWMLAELDALPFDGACVWDADYTRGFVSEIHLFAAAFLQHADSIFRAHPVTSVRLTDREPWALDTVNCAWWSERGGQAHNRGSLPHEIYKRLRGHRENFGGKTYTSAEGAWAALSLACVAYGHALAGLPALTPHPSPLA
jgi:uncharacterized protein (TIGR02996 family)